MKGINYHIAAWGLVLVAFLATGIYGMPPNPDRIEEESAKGTPLPYYLANGAQLTELSIDAPSRISAAAKSQLAGSFRALAVLIKFSDKNSSVAPSAFDTLLFVNRQGTVRSYYYEVSYGNLDIVTVNLPSSIGWNTAPQTYAYYCNGQNGTGPYPQNSQKLCEDIVDLINPVVNFADYDNDDDGFVDALILIHTGPGAEFTLSDNDIWSHKWGISPRLKDGVYISEYCIQPEFWNTAGDITCGVFCHELGHIFGLPDLYDTDTPRDAYGIGRWSLMAYGSWNGTSGMGNSPAEPDAWSRIQLGFSSATNVITNMAGASIASVEGGGPIYRLWSSGGAGNEYYLIENRQKTGYDQYLPAAGLLIWHIDQSQATNDNQWYPGYESSGHYLVALEQADGLFELDKNLSSGNAGDPFPGSSSNSSFSSASIPNSNAYSGDITYIAVGNISPSGAIMTANLQVSLSSDVEISDDETLPTDYFLDQNYPNPFNPSTVIRATLPRATDLTLSIYDILGQKIRNLADGHYAGGKVSFTWDGRDNSGRPVPSGIYLYELVAADYRESREMVLIK